MRQLEIPRCAYELEQLIDRSTLDPTLLALESEGYIKRQHEHDGCTWWTTTVRGNALGGASFRRPITRATAERLLGGVVQRAGEYNADSTHLYAIAEVLVFGSYLDPAATDLGDLDIGATIRPRPQFDSSTEQFTALLLNYADNSGRRFNTFYDRLSWASREPFLFLKNRSSAIKITVEDVRRLTDRWEVVYQPE